MSRIPKSLPESLDSSPLTLEKLSDHELSIILSIEYQLEMKRHPISNPGGSKKSYLAPVQVRSPNVLFLDGARGTGKTSLLLTMAHRWNLHSNCDVKRHDHDVDKYRKRICRIQDLQFKPRETIPHQIHPLRILDFDPIPPQMPLIAGIVHAWEPLATIYDELADVPVNYDEEDGTLTDRWDRLFRVAAVGWSPVPAAKGLLEQVLDRQEQVREWQRLGQRWHEFVTEVIDRGKRLTGEHRLDDNPMFVIMIDDVDLQVERIRELLPALRLLYHPNVAFLVAADWSHLVDTLKVDFLGRQNRLSNREIERNAFTEADEDKWAGILADAAATKVFPLKNKWALRRLTVHELLEFPGTGGDGTDLEAADRDNPSTMKMILNEWPRDPKGEPSENVKLGNYLNGLFGFQDGPYEVPPFITYRDAHQIFEKASMQGDNGRRAIEAVRLLFSGTGTQAVTLGGVGAPEPLVEYQWVGELVSLFRQGYFAETSASSGIEVSARPDFVIRKGRFPEPGNIPEAADNEGDCIRAMLAMTLLDEGYGVAAPGLQWNIRLALAWTRVRVSDENSFLKLAFQWRFHEHPHPFRLIEWSLDWRKFVLNIQASPTQRLERIAYAWTYFQAKWLNFEVADASNPIEVTSISHDDWDFLLNTVLAGGSQNQTSARSQGWLTQTLPLLARPEIGLPPDLQEALLSYVDGGPHSEKKHRQREWLKDQRRRLVTDAIIAAGEEEGRRAENAENERRVESIVRELEKQYLDVYGVESPWLKVVESNSR